MLLSTVSGYVFAGPPLAPFLARSKAISTRVQPPSRSHSSRARSFGLRAALALTKLTESTARPLEAIDALEGFSPTLHRGGQALKSLQT